MVPVNSDNRKLPASVLVKALEFDGYEPVPALKNPDNTLAFEDRKKAKCLEVPDRLVLIIHSIATNQPNPLISAAASHEAPPKNHFLTRPRNALLDPPVERAAFGIVERAAFGVIERAAFGVVEGAAFGIVERAAFGVVEEAAFGIVEGAAVIEGAFGIVESAAFGVIERAAFGVAEGAAFGIVEGVAFGVVERATFSVVEGAMYGAIEEAAFGISVEFEAVALSKQSPPRCARDPPGPTDRESAAPLATTLHSD
ncbi:A-kinase anchor protein 5 [Eumeta japonica]|uniref:A-kinase anchor protein 5 n=1 Tax=Eumeta variegata TaxID=151549 RepID=A0A4C1UFS0_EUMVA|nr:A-kinase anchor protein 5 [Eumeta japonica]